jgi:hypothetical protein
MSADSQWLEESDDSETLVLSDLINRVLDKGVVISSHITISIADVDLLQLALQQIVSAVATLQRRAKEQRADLSLRPDPRP